MYTTLDKRFYASASEGFLFEYSFNKQYFSVRDTQWDIRNLPNHKIFCQ